jgi:hypothetical protein
VVLATAALLSARIVVIAGTATPTCTVLRPHQTVHLMAGQQVEFVANRAPTVTGVPPGAGTGAVSVRAAAGPTGSGGGDLPTKHMIITVTAVHPGTVELTWINCSGTAC